MKPSRSRNFYTGHQNTPEKHGDAVIPGKIIWKKENGGLQPEEDEGDSVRQKLMDTRGPSFTGSDKA